jgi:hypothetical protein
MPRRHGWAEEIAGKAVKTKIITTSVRIRFTIYHHSLESGTPQLCQVPLSRLFLPVRTSTSTAPRAGARTRAWTKTVTSTRSVTSWSITTAATAAITTAFGISRAKASIRETIFLGSVADLCPQINHLFLQSSNLGLVRFCLVELVPELKSLCCHFVPKRQRFLLEIPESIHINL